MFKFMRDKLAIKAFRYVSHQHDTIKLLIVWQDKTTRFDWLISGPSKVVLDRQKAYWTKKSKTVFNKQKQKG